MPQVHQFLVPLTFKQVVVINATDGTETLAGAGRIFTGYLDSDFKKWKTDQPSKPTEMQPVRVMEMRQDATVVTMFGSLGSDLDALCLTQSQIRSFCVEHPDKLRQEGYATFFLFKVKEEHFVANVRVDGGMLWASVSRFGFPNVWHAVYRHRVVVPQL